MKNKKNNSLKNNPSNRNASKYQKPIKTVTIEVRTHNDKKGGHPHGIIDEVDDNYVSVGFTRDKKKGKNNTNYPLEVNPLGKQDKAYMRRQATIDKKRNYKSAQKGQMTGKDYTVAKTYAERAKSKYKGKKGQKKQ